MYQVVHILANGILLTWQSLYHGVKIQVPTHLEVCGICGQQKKNVLGLDMRAGPSDIRKNCQRFDVPVGLGKMVRATVM